MRQQLDSFNEFVNSSMQEIVDENKDVIVRPRSQVGISVPDCRSQAASRLHFISRAGWGSASSSPCLGTSCMCLRPP